VFRALVVTLPKEEAPPLVELRGAPSFWSIPPGRGRASRTAASKSGLCCLDRRPESAAKYGSTIHDPRSTRLPKTSTAAENIDRCSCPLRTSKWYPNIVRFATHPGVREFVWPGLRYSLSPVLWETLTCRIRSRVCGGGGGDARRYVVCVGGVLAYDRPEGSKAKRPGSRPTARLRLGATVTVVAQQRDWLKVRPPTPPTPPPRARPRAVPGDQACHC